MDQPIAGDDYRGWIVDGHSAHGGHVVLPDAEIFKGRVSTDSAGDVFARDARGSGGN